jgi:ABC-2 type transport system permease protein
MTMGINWVGLFTFLRKEVQRVMRVAVQTIFSPLISATLYIFIFGHVIGSRIDLIAGVPYITFVFPGILMMNIIGSSFEHTASSVFMGKFLKSIEEMLVSPFSYIEMIVGFVLSAVVRATIVSLGILSIGMLFGAVDLNNIWLFLFYSVAVSTIFALIGMIIGLWAKGFEQFSLINIFIIMPFSFLGGIFYSVSMLPEKAQIIAHINPFFYFIDGIRHAMIGYSEANTLVGLALIFGLIAVLGTIVVHLFKIGWRIRA